MSNDIKKIIENAYEARGVRMVCKHNNVTVEGDKVTVQLNTEDPYLGAEFFSLIDEIIEKIEELGYSKEGSEFLFDYYICNFSV